MADAKQAERQRRYRIREQAKARALFAGAIEIEIAWFGVNADGEHVAIDYDGDSIPLNVKARAVAAPVEPEKPSNVTTISSRTRKAVKVYAPKSWDPAQWNANVEIIQRDGMSKQEVITNLAEVAQKQNTAAAHKRVKHAAAVLDALPDTPDWYDHLPLADV